MMGMTVITTADRVRSLIRHSGGTQREFGERIGLDELTMSRCLGDLRRFTSLDLARIADTNKVSVDWLLSGQMWGLVRGRAHRRRGHHAASGGRRGSSARRG